MENIKSIFIDINLKEIISKQITGIVIYKEFINQKKYDMLLDILNVSLCDDSPIIMIGDDIQYKYQDYIDVVNSYIKSDCKDNQLENILANREEPDVETWTSFNSLVYNELEDDIVDQMSHITTNPKEIFFETHTINEYLIKPINYWLHDHIITDETLVNFLNMYILLVYNVKQK